MNNNKGILTDENNGISSLQVEQAIKELSKLIVKSGDEQFVYDFFVCLFTQPELKDIANRWFLVKEIDSGATQREIAKKYRMSLCKITRGSKELSKPDSAFKKMLELLKNS